jgi:hypothetical protein
MALLYHRSSGNIRKLPGKIKRDFEKIARPSEGRKGGSYGGRGVKGLFQGQNAGIITLFLPGKKARRLGVPPHCP